MEYTFFKITTDQDYLNNLDKNNLGVMCDNPVNLYDVKLPDGVQFIYKFDFELDPETIWSTEELVEYEKMVKDNKLTDAGMELTRTGVMYINLDTNNTSDVPGQTFCVNTINDFIHGDKFTSWEINADYIMGDDMERFNEIKWFNKTYPHLTLPLTGRRSDKNLLEVLQVKNHGYLDQSLIIEMGKLGVVLTSDEIVKIAMISVIKDFKLDEHCVNITNDNIIHLIATLEHTSDALVSLGMMRSS